MNKQKLYDLMDSDVVADVFANKDSVTKEQLFKFIFDLHEILYPIYCEDCGACGHAGCCPPTKCLHFDDYKEDYEWLEKDWWTQNQALQQAKQMAGFKLERDDENRIIVVCEPLKTKNDNCPELAEWLSVSLDLYGEEE